MYLYNQNQDLLSYLFKTPRAKVGLLGFSLLFTGFALFPYGVLAEKSRLFRFIVYQIFDSELAHVIGHFTLFGLIGTAVLLFFPKLLSYPILYLSVMLNMAWIQEFLQLATFKRRPISVGELFDLGVDLAAAVFVFFIVTCLQRGIGRRSRYRDLGPNEG